MSRLEKAKQIPDNYVEIIRWNEEFKEYGFTVDNGKGNIYFVNCTNNKWDCSCPDHSYRHVDCKHILKCKMVLSENNHKQIKVNKLNEIEDEIFEIKNLINSVGKTEYLVNKLNNLLIKKIELIE